MPLELGQPEGRLKGMTWTMHDLSAIHGQNDKRRMALPGATRRDRQRIELRLPLRDNRYLWRTLTAMVVDPESEPLVPVTVI